MGAEILLMAVFMGFLYAMAWQDYKTGTVDFALLAASCAATLGLVFVSSLFGWIVPAVNQRIICGVLVAVPFTMLAACKKMGGADVVIFTQISVLFGLSPFVFTLMFACIGGLVWTGVKLLRGKNKGKGNVTIAQLRKMEIRFIPFIAAAAQVVLVCWWLGG